MVHQPGRGGKPRCVVTVDELNALPLPDGWAFTEVHQYVFAPEQWRAVLASDEGEPHVLHGCTSTDQVDRMLRTYLPVRGVRYPEVGGEQMSMEVEA